MARASSSAPISFCTVLESNRSVRSSRTKCWVWERRLNVCPNAAPGPSASNTSVTTTPNGVCRFTTNAAYLSFSFSKAQAGLSWATILKKRDNYRAAFDNFDPALVGALRRPRAQAPTRQRRHRPQPPEDRLGNSEREIVSRRSTRIWHVRQIHLAIRRRPPKSEQVALDARRPRQNPRVRCNEQGPPPPRLPLRRQHHLLRLHAGRRHGE